MESLVQAWYKIGSVRLLLGSITSSLLEYFVSERSGNEITIALADSQCSTFIL